MTETRTQANQRLRKTCFKLNLAENRKTLSKEGYRSWRRRTAARHYKQRADSREAHRARFKRKYAVAALATAPAPALTTVDKGAVAGAALKQVGTTGAASPEYVDVLRVRAVGGPMELEALPAPPPAQAPIDADMQ